MTITPTFGQSHALAHIILELVRKMIILFDFDETMAKHLLLYFLFFFAFCCIQAELSAQTVLLNYFTLEADGASIVLEWEMQGEEGIQEFRLFRKFNDEPSLAHVVSLTANGAFKYKYLDDDIFKTQGRVIHYELHIVTSTKTHKFYATHSHNPTSIQRTWGSIKSMFR